MVGIMEHMVIHYSNIPIFQLIQFFSEVQTLHRIHLHPTPLPFLKKPLKQPYQQRQNYTNDDHRGNGKIKLKIFTFNANISRKPAQPGEPLASSKIKNNPHNDYQYPDNDDDFSELLHHCNYLPAKVNDSGNFLNLYLNQNHTK
jgi:hypothetical protein